LVTAIFKKIVSHVKTVGELFITFEIKNSSMANRSRNRQKKIQKKKNPLLSPKEKKRGKERKRNPEIP